MKNIETAYVEIATRELMKPICMYYWYEGHRRGFWMNIKSHRTRW